MSRHTPLPATLVAALGLALATPSAPAREFNWTFDLTGGEAAQRFDGVGQLVDWFVTPVAQNLDLQGEVRIDTLSILAPGSMLSENGGYFDTDVIFLPSRSPNALPGQRLNRTTIDALPVSGARWSYVIRSDTSGAQSFDANWDFRSESGTALPFLHLVKFSEGGPFNTLGGGVNGGLRAQIRVWSAAAPTSVQVDRFRVTATGTIVRYQILPTPNDGTVDVEPGDDAFSEIEFFNGGTLRVRDRLTNRSSGRIGNAGSVEIAEAADRTELLNRGEVFNDRNATFTNSGRVANEAGGTLINLGSFTNRASFPGPPSPLGPDEPTARDPGFFNRGTVLMDGGSFLNDEGRFFNEGTVSVGADGGFTNRGQFSNGRPSGGEATFISLGRTLNDAGSFANYARVESNGLFRNAALLDNLGVLVAGEGGPSGDGRFENDGTLRNRTNFAISILDRTDATIRVDGLLHNRGTIENHAVIAMNGELRNEGQLDSRGDFRFDPGVKLSVAGLLQNSGTVTTDSFMQVAGGRVENAGTLNNGGELSVLDGGLVTGGVVNNGGIVRIAGDGTMTDLVLYRQNGSDAATTVNGRLHAALVQIDAGVLQGSDRLEAGEIVIGANATVGPGNSPGTLTLAGTVLLDGALELEIGPGASDHLVVEGGLFFGEGARVRYSFIEGFLPEAGRRYTFSDFVTAGLISRLDQVSFETSGLPTGSLVAWDGSDFSVTAVPEPQTWAMFAAGLSVFAFAARRRRAR